MSSGQKTEAEIYRQPTAWKSCLNRLDKEPPSLFDLINTSSVKESIFFGSGSSYYLALSASRIFRHQTGTAVRACPSAELIQFSDLYLESNLDRQVLGVGFSRSGQTTEVLQAANLLDERYGFPTCGVTCSSDSPLTQKSDRFLSLPWVKEKSVVMTSSFTTMLLGVLKSGLYVAEDKASHPPLGVLPQTCEKLLEKYTALIQDLVSKGDFTEFVFLGAGPLFGLACESALKLKEMALVSSESYHPLEYRHGPKSKAGKQTLITLYASDSGYRQEKQLIPDLQDLGASVLVIAEDLDGSLKKPADYWVELDSDLGEFARSPLYVPFAQLLGLQLARAKGMDPDEPENLTQVVRLENEDS